VFLFKCYWYDTTDRGIIVDPHYGLVQINSKARLRNVNDVFVFANQCQQVYYTYTPSFRKDRSRVDWLSLLKTKPKGRVEVVQDENEDTNMIDEVFQVFLTWQGFPIDGARCSRHVFVVYKVLSKLQTAEGLRAPLGF
jgi:hypothetical protein